METQNLLIIDSYSLGSRFNNSCPVCAKMIVYQQSFAFCSCPIFFHTQCFLSKINQKEIIKQPKLKCLYCQEMIEIEYSSKPQLKCKKKITLNSVYCLLVMIASLVISIYFGIIGTQLLSSESISQNIMSVYFLLALIFCIVIFMTALGKFVFNTCFKEEVTAIGVKQLHKSIEFSAFKDMGATEQHSDCMILN